MQIWPAGTIQIPASNLANNVTGYSLEIARCTSVDPSIWPDPLSLIELDMEVSLDNGATWAGGAFTAYGGIDIREGVEVLTSNISFDVPPGTKRKVRGTVNLSADIYTTADLTTFTG